MSENSQKITAFIPVRGGSKGLPNKNQTLLGSHPLMAWPIMMAKMTLRVDEVIVSTDDAHLKRIAIDYGAEVVDRPSSLAGDNVGLYEVILHYRDHLRKDRPGKHNMILLEVTSPFRDVDMLSKTCDLLLNGYDSVATFKEVHSHPLQTWSIDENDAVSTFIDGANPWVRRQELPKAFELSGEVYGFNLDLLPRTPESLLVGKTYPLKITAGKSVDINTKNDMLLAQQLFPESALAKLEAKFEK